MIRRYRIRWDRVTNFNKTERRCIAEKQLIVFKIFEFWLPLTNGYWRRTEEEAHRDIESDKALFAPLPEPTEIP